MTNTESTGTMKPSEFMAKISEVTTYRQEGQEPPMAPLLFAGALSAVADRGHIKLV